MEVVRGKGGSKSTTVPSTIQIANGKVIVAKILPAAPWVLTDSPALLLSDTAWKATLAASGDWQSPSLRRLRMACGRLPRPHRTGHQSAPVEHRRRNV